MIDLEAQGPVYHGHKLARIVDALDSGKQGAYWDRYCNNFAQERKPSKPLSTRGWARLDVRVIGNCWGLSVSDVADDQLELPDHDLMDWIEGI